MNEKSIYEKLVQGQPGWCSLRDQSLWKVYGKDRTKYLNGQIPADLSSLPVGQSLHTAALNRKGRIDCELWIANQQEAFYIDAPKEIKESTEKRLTSFLVADKVSIEQLDNSYRLYHYFGLESPKGFELCFFNKRFGIPGWDIWTQTGIENFSCMEIPPKILESLRLEAMIPRWGSELTANIIALEAFLNKEAISFTKGCYVGQEIISRIHHLGQVNHLLTLFLCLDDNVPQCAPLFDQNQAVGRLTSSCYSFGYEKPVALGFLRKEFRKEGNVLRTSNDCYLKILKAPPPIG
ncbi:CAF17-like 4Fe-4S cluster assembly/insertion protein YgfZ [Methylacidiphilum kamchatkense]|uniref:CAF17-like 4Fe-4S cluster assembly/insertion protein YgfZ n=1 Tax=Methylacidiphilum kamchatkense TaxID=431057 RepID=UPI00068A8C92|nr:glycine cleavage T C-terminal barrel domain-containing protein [Methylacidiphilum kamchatkense]